MCNSSFLINGSALYSGKEGSWFCMCQARIGSLFVVFVLTVYLIVGTPIHCWSFWMFFRGNTKANVVFSLSMTTAELLYCVQCFVDIFDFIFSTTLTYNFTTYLAGAIWTFRPLVQICMCIEQYLAVIHPVTFLKYKGLNYRIALVSVIVLFALGNGVRLVAIRTNYFRDHVFCQIFWIAVAIISFCCASVLRTLKRPGPGDQNNVEMTQSDRQKKTERVKGVENQHKRKAFRIITHILVSILCCYFPIVVVYFMCIPGVSTRLFLCEVVPPFLTVSKIALLLTPLFRMYSEGYLKCITCFQGQFK